MGPFSIWALERLDLLVDLGVLGGFSRVSWANCLVGFSGVEIGSIELRDNRREDLRVGVVIIVRLGVCELGV